MSSTDPVFSCDAGTIRRTRVACAAHGAAKPLLAAARPDARTVGSRGRGRCGRGSSAAATTRRRRRGAMGAAGRRHRPVVTAVVRRIVCVAHAAGPRHAARRPRRIAREPCRKAAAGSAAPGRPHDADLADRRKRIADREAGADWCPLVITHHGGVARRHHRSSASCAGLADCGVLPRFAPVIGIPDLRLPCLSTIGRAAAL